MILAAAFLGSWNTLIVLILWKNTFFSRKLKGPFSFWLTEVFIPCFLLLALKATAILINFNLIISYDLILVLVNCWHLVIQLKILCLFLKLLLQTIAIVSHSNFIIFFSLILVLLISCDKVQGPILVFEIGFANNGNSAQFSFNCIF